MEKWSEKNTFEKVMDIVSWVALCVWIVFEILERRGVAHAGLVNCIALCVTCSAQALSLWREKRIFSYIALLGVALIVAVIIMEIV